MDSGLFRFISCHPMTRQQLSPALNLSSVAWTETRNGNGTLEATVTLPKSRTARNQLRPALEPDESAIYVRTPSGGYVWGGVIVDQDLDWRAGTCRIVAEEWRTWLYSVFLGPKADLTADNLYSWDDKDQLTIAREIVQYAITGGTADGRPPIDLPIQTSGKLRDLHIKGTDFKYAGEILDTVSQRDGGFEWGIDIDSGTDSLPQLRLALDFPERGGIIDGLLFMQTEKGANCRPIGEVKRSSRDRATRSWATGAAENSVASFANDTDPAVADGYTLLREKVSNYSTVSERDTLSAHARSEREYRSPKINTLDIEVTLDSPMSVLDYTCGDRARLLLDNGWYQEDKTAVRIITRQFEPLLNRVLVTLDLEDYEIPETDTEGTV